VTGYSALYEAVYPNAAPGGGEDPPPDPIDATIGQMARVLIDGVYRAVWLIPRKPGLLNTGVRGAYTGLTASGPLTVSTPGAVIDGLDITGTLTIAAHNVTVQNSRVRAIKNAGSYAVAWSNVSGVPPTGLQIIDTEIDGNGTDGGDVGPYPSGWALSASIQPGIGYALLRCDIHSMTDGVKPQDNPAGSSILIDRCWIHDLTTYYSSAGAITHNDILQIAGSGAHDVTVRRCLLDGYRVGDPNIESRYASSSLMQWGSFPGNAGVLADILIEDNWIDGGGFASRLDFDTAATLTGLIIRRNRFGLHHRFGAFQSGDPAIDGHTVTLSGNVWDVAGTTDSGLTVTAGQATP
jgi:hypothetical protein